MVPSTLPRGQVAGWTWGVGQHKGTCESRQSSACLHSSLFLSTFFLFHVPLPQPGDEEDKDKCWMWSWIYFQSLWCHPGSVPSFHERGECKWIIPPLWINTQTRDHTRVSSPWSVGWENGGKGSWLVGHLDFSKETWLLWKPCLPRLFDTGPVSAVAELLKPEGLILNTDKNKKNVTYLSNLCRDGRKNHFWERDYMLFDSFSVCPLI